MIYSLSYFHNGETHELSVNADEHDNLFTACEQMVHDETSSPDTPFQVADSSGNVLFTDENIK